MEQQAYSYLPEVSMDPAPEPSMFTPMAEPFTKDQQLRIMIEDAKIAKNTGETMFNTTMERKRRAADMSVIDPIAQDHRERIRQQEEIANRITSIITPQMADEQAKAQAAQEQQQQLIGQLAAMQAPEQKRGQMGIADILSAGIAALFGGAQGVNQAIEGGYQRAGQDAQMQFQNEGRQFEQDQQNIMLQLQQLGLDEKTAQHAFDVLQGRQWNLQDQDTQRADAIADDARTFDREQLKQGQLTEREKMRIEGRRSSTEYQSQMNVIRDGLKQAYNLSDPAQKMEAISRLNRMVATGEMEGFMRDDLARELSGNTFQQDSLKAKTDTEIAMRPWKVGKAKADIQKVLGGIKLDDARKRQIEQKISFYDDEFQLRAANIYSQMATRELKGTGAADYWGKGYEGTFNAMKNVAEKQLLNIQLRNAGRLAAGGQLPADEQASLDAATRDLQLAKDSLVRIAEGKAAKAKALATGDSGNIPVDLGLGANPLSGPIGGGIGGINIRPETKRTQPRTKKTTPAKKKTVTRGNWKIEIER